MQEDEVEATRCDRWYLEAALAGVSRFQRCCTACCNKTSVKVSSSSGTKGSQQHGKGASVPDQKPQVSFPTLLEARPPIPRTERGRSAKDIHFDLKSSDAAGSWRSHDRRARGDTMPKNLLGRTGSMAVGDTFSELLSWAADTSSDEEERRRCGGRPATASLAARTSTLGRMSQTSRTERTSHPAPGHLRSVPWDAEPDF
eukprot:TRINITY_DN23117_c0_g1_i1.p1 TRINITY_DN23117_c0_g1~~TRINITY_DN23117_c0_g1_i1.p1  ORF type:complete len:200 (+),score=31.44 TRINITY_DN23117_c0_g1_i1:238-837(+)